MRCSDLALAALVLVATATYVRAESFSCKQEQNSRCDKAMAKDPNKSCKVGLGSCTDATKKACCEPPPCQYRFQLQMWLMLQDLATTPEVQACAKGDIEGYLNHLAYTRPFLNHLPNCPKSFLGHSLGNPPGFSTTSKDHVCEIDGDDNAPTTLAESKAKSSTCSEFIEIDWDHENVHMRQCSSAHAAGNPYPPIIQADMGWNEVDAYELSIAEMRDAFKHWSSSCTPEKNLEHAEKQARRGIQALKKQTATAAAKGKCP
jgi:hypothetical protein